MRASNNEPQKRESISVNGRELATYETTSLKEAPLDGLSDETRRAIQKAFLEELKKKIEESHPRF